MFVIKAINWGAEKCISVPTSLQSYFRQVGDVSLTQINMVALKVVEFCRFRMSTTCSPLVPP